MVNEWVKVELEGANNSGDKRRYTISGTAAVSFGQLLALSDPRTAAAADGATTCCAGVAAEDKEASDPATSISVFTEGIFEAKASGAIAVGAPIRAAESNMIRDAGTASGAIVIGYALETAADAEVINVRLRL